MEHNKIKELIPLYIYNELDREELKDFEQHIENCGECKLELLKQKHLLNSIQLDKFPKTDDDLLFEARSELRKKLREQRKSGGFFKPFLENFNLLSAGGLKMALGSLTLVIVGFFAGYLTFNSQKVQGSPVEVTPVKNDYSLLQNDVRIKNVRLIDQNSDGEIEFEFEAVKPIKMKGNIKDQNIQSILAYSMLNEENPGSRLNSISAIKNTASADLDKEIKESVLKVAQLDENSGVRREALKLLREFPFDTKIKDALLYILINDKNSGLRIEAINSLIEAKKKGYNFDESELNVFKQKMQADENNYIRYQARTVWEDKIQ